MRTTPAGKLGPRTNQYSLPRPTLPRFLAVAVLCSLVLGSIGNASSTAAQDGGSTTAPVAPADALAFVQIPLDESSPQVALGRELLDRAGLGDELDAALRERLSDDAGNPLPLDTFLGGEIGIVVTPAVLQQAVAGAGVIPVGGEAETPVTDLVEAGAAQAAGWAVILDARAPDTAFAGLRETLNDQAAATGAAVEEQDYAGVTIASVASGTGDTGEDEPGRAVARVDDHVLIASVPADLEPVIDAAQGTIANVASVDAYTRLRGVLGGEYLAFGFLNGPASTQAQSALGGLGQTAGGLVGGDRISAFTISADQPGFRMETATMAADGSPLPAAAPFTSDLLAQTPSEALLFLSATDLAATGFLDGLGAAVLGGVTGGMGAPPTPAAGQSAEAFIAAQYEAVASLIGFNPQTELFQRLSGEYGLWIQSQADPSSIAALFSSGVDDPGAVVQAVNQLSTLIQGGAGGALPTTTRTVDGSTVTTLALGPGFPAIEYGVVADRLQIGFGNAIDRDVAGGSLADNPQFQAVMATLPAESNGTLYVDLAQVMPLLQALQAADAATGDSAIVDANPNCANYATQEEAQASYDNLEEGTFDLDENFDGVACEGFFSVATPPPADETGDVLSQLDLSAIRAFALAARDDDGMRRSSSILYVDGGGA